MKIVFAIIFSLLVFTSVKGVAQASVKVKNNTAYSVTVFVETSAGLNSEVFTAGMGKTYTYPVPNYMEFSVAFPGSHNAGHIILRNNVNAVLCCRNFTSSQNGVGFCYYALAGQSSYTFDINNGSCPP